MALNSDWFMILGSIWFTKIKDLNHNEQIKPNKKNILKFPTHLCDQWENDFIFCCNDSSVDSVRMFSKEDRWFTEKYFTRKSGESVDWIVKGNCSVEDHNPNWEGTN